MKTTILIALLAVATVTIMSASVDVAGDLGEQTHEALLRALEDERHAQAIYQAVMDRQGEVRPFSNIRLAEERHESCLLDLFEKYEIEPPDDPWQQRVIEVPETRSEACAIAVEAEKANIALYDELLQDIERSDIRDVFTRLRNASLERHLPAFERCGTGGGKGGQGQGRGQGQGQGRGNGNGWGQGCRSSSETLSLEKVDDAR